MAMIGNQMFQEILVSVAFVAVIFFDKHWFLTADSFCLYEKLNLAFPGILKG